MVGSSNGGPKSGETREIIERNDSLDFPGFEDHIRNDSTHIFCRQVLATNIIENKNRF